MMDIIEKSLLADKYKERLDSENSMGVIYDTVEEIFKLEDIELVKMILKKYIYSR